jgi:replicative DNA helicase
MPRRDNRRHHDHEPPPVAGRVPPHDLGAEQAVLSAVLLRPGALDDVLTVLRPEHFYAEAHKLMFEACVALAQAGQPVDAVQVAGWLRDRQRIQQVGGAPYIGQVVDASPAVAHLEAHARVVRDKWRVRRLIATCQRFAAEGYGDYGEAQHFLDEAEGAIHAIAQAGTDTATVTLKQALQRAFADVQRAADSGGLVGVSTGLTDLDKKTTGLHRGDLTIVAARPGMGKSALATSIAAAATAPPSTQPEGKRRHVLVCTLEMPHDQLALRWAAQDSGTDLRALREGQRVNWAALTESAQHLSGLPIQINDTAPLNVLQLRALARRAQSAAKRDGAALALVVVDYLQLMSPVTRDRSRNRENEVSEMSRGLKLLAKELGVHVLALSQLNRSVESRKDKRPMLADLRESGAIEQDADNVMFIFRADYYLPDQQRGLAEIIVAKQRNGPTGKVLARYVAECTRFENLAQQSFDEQDWRDAS